MMTTPFPLSEWMALNDLRNDSSIIINKELFYEGKPTCFSLKNIFVRPNFTPRSRDNFGERFSLSSSMSYWQQASSRIDRQI